MRKRLMLRPVVFLFALLLSSFRSYSQALSPEDRYSMNAKLLRLVSDYEYFASFPTRTSTQDFCRLFTKDARVMCDYFSNKSFCEAVTVRDYVNFYSNDIKSLRVDIKNIKKGKYSFSGGRWHVTVTMDKSVAYLDKGSVYFSQANSTMDGSFELELDCVMDEKDGEFLISGIKGKYNGSGNPKDEFLLVKRDNVREDILDVVGDTVSFRDEDYRLMKRDCKFASNDTDVELTQKVAETPYRYDILTFGYKVSKMRTRVKAAFAPFGAYSITSPVSFNTKKSSAYEVGVDIGYMWRLTKLDKFGINTGFGVSFSSISLEVSDVNYEMNMYDEVKGYYSREYSFSKINEGLKFTDVVIPLYLAYEHQCGKRIVFTLDAGMKLFLNTSTKIVPYTVAGQVNLISGDEVFLSDDISGTYLNYLVPVNYGRNTYDLSAFVRTGIDVLLTKRFYFLLQAGYEYGLKPSYRSSLSQWLSPSENIYPFVYSNKQARDVAVRSFYDCVSYRRNAFWMETGLKLKF